MNEVRNPHDKKVHTPGPWDVQDPLGDGPNKWIYADGLYIAEVDGEREEAEASARLIAAAPQLLRAVKDAKEYIEAIATLEMKEGVSFLESDPLAMARLFDRAIAEAEGQPA